MERLIVLPIHRWLPRSQTARPYVRVILGSCYHNGKAFRYYSSLKFNGNVYPNLKRLRLSKYPPSIKSRTIATAVIARVLRSALKIRYIVIGSAVGGGVQLRRVSRINAVFFSF